MSVVDVLLVGVLAATPPAVRLREEAVVASVIVRLGDVADLSDTPVRMRSALAEIPIARFAPGQSRLVLTGRRIAERTRGAAPAAAALVRGLDGARIVLTRVEAPRPVPTSNPPGACLRVGRTLKAGAIVARDDVEPADCAGAEPALGYDRRLGLARARDVIVAGATVRRPPAATLAAASFGQRVMLRANVGPVVVERDVEVVRAARAGAPLLVRGDDGMVFAGPALNGTSPQ